MRRRNDSLRLTDVMERSLRVLAGRLSTDARVCTGVHGRFGRDRLATEPVVRTETSSSILAFDLPRVDGVGEGPLYYVCTTVLCP